MLSSDVTTKRKKSFETLLQTRMWSHFLFLLSDSIKALMTSQLQCLHVRQVLTSSVKAQCVKCFIRMTSAYVLWFYMSPINQNWRWVLHLGILLVPVPLNTETSGHQGNENTFISALEPLKQIIVFWLFSAQLFMYFLFISYSKHF